MRILKSKISIIAVVASISLTSFAQKNFVSDFHKTHGGQIVFNKEANPDIKSASVFSSDFTSKEDVTAYVYMSDLMQDYEIYNLSEPNKLFKNIQRHYFIKYFLDDVEQKVSKTNDALTSDKEGIMAFTIAVLRVSGNVSHNDFRNAVLKLPGGKQKVRIEMWAGKTGNTISKEPVAKGEFTLDKIEFVEAIVGKYSSIAAGMTNPALAQQALKLVNEQALAEGLGFKYSKPIIVDKDWTVVRDEIAYDHKIICRTITMVCYQVGPKKDVCRAVDFKFKQMYSGGKYSNTLLYNGMGHDERVNCE